MLHENIKMASEQPLKKKQRIEGSDEIDFKDAMTTTTGLQNLSSLHLSLPQNVNENQIENWRNSDKTIVKNSENTQLSDSLYGNEITSGLNTFQVSLVKGCLCESASDFSQVFLLDSQWNSTKILHFLSNCELSFEIYLKQNNRGSVCSRLALICDEIVENPDFFPKILCLINLGNPYVNYLNSKVISNLFLISKNRVKIEWLESVFNLLNLDNFDHFKLNFSLDVIKRIVQFKENDTQHVLEEPKTQSVCCSSLNFQDSESFDTSPIKGIIIKNLILKWSSLVGNIKLLIENDASMESKSVVVTFLELWEEIISVKTNLSVVDIKPFYDDLDAFLVYFHTGNLNSIISRQILSLFNEVLCYGSTLALQDLLPEEICKLAHFIIRHVKDGGLLDNFYEKVMGGRTTFGEEPKSFDKMLCQKLVLLILKSVAISVKETRSDSSDSSVGSEDSDYNQDMSIIGRSMKDVLKKVENFLKLNLNFHPESSLNKILCHLFDDQDDYLIESMVCTLDIIVGIPGNCNVFPELTSMLDPTRSFVEFLKITRYNSDILLDFLVSNETCFLLYLLRFLKYLRKSWGIFVRRCQEYDMGEFDATMSVLGSLSEQIERLVVRNLFPYNIDPILRLLKVCNNLYEGNEYC